MKIAALKFLNKKNNCIYVSTGENFKICFDKANKTAKENERINIESYFGERNNKQYLTFLEKINVVLE